MHLLRVAASRLLATQSSISQLGGVRAFNDEASSRRLHLAANIVQPNYTLKAQEESSIRLVIFDKDGVLVDFSHMWLPWAENTVSLINEMTSKDHTEDVFRALGVCPLTKKVKPGPLAEKTLPLIRQDIADMLRRISYTHPQAEEIAHSCVREANYSHAERTRSIVDLRPVFETLNSMGIYTAVCTADFRKAVECQLQLLGIDEYPSMVMCGDDTGAKPKPDPHCALKICEKLGVQPHEAIVVGDTIVDMRMGRAAGLRASVAVLSGIGCPATLSPWADHYINDVSEVAALIKEKWMKTETNKNMEDYQLCF